MRIPRIRLRPALAFTTIGLGLVTACKSLGTPADQQRADSLWDQMQGHEQWGYFDAHPGMMEGNGPHGEYVETRINAVAARDQADPPFGSILVKENYGSQDRSSLESYTVMQRVEGYDPENGDWFWARWSADGELTHAGKVGMCYDCHFDAQGDDFVFLND